MTQRRIVVGLDAGPRGRATLEAAAQVAARMQAELVGLFVEDIDLLHLAGMPFAREVGYPSAVLRPLDVAAMERALSATAQEVQRTLAAIAGRAPLSWSFRIARGAVLPELRAAAAGGDIVVTGALRVTLGSPLAVLCTAATPPEQLAPAATALASTLGGTVEILLLDGESEAAEAWRHQVRALLMAHKSAARVLFA
jgi:nucleotide-binding universal stress UspA family protein